MNAMQSFEDRIKDLLEKKLQTGELEALHGFFTIKGVYRYSLNNSILIMLQGGSLALGFHRWNAIGRHVKRGEHANIEILIPHIQKQERVVNGAKESIDTCHGFFTRKVFDIKQTDGQPLEYMNNTAQDINLDYFAMRLALGAALKIDISEDFTGSARGYYTYAKDSIVVSTMNNNVDKIKVLAHEVGHYLLHKDARGLSHPAKEVEAELVAALVCATLGINIDNNASYIAAYNQHKPQVRVLKVIAAVQRIIKIIVPDTVEAPAELATV